MEENKKNLIKYFNELYNIEKGARDLYSKFLLDLKDKDDIKKVSKIRDEEEKHMQIVEKIIKIIKSPK
jgi:rubrerythrin